MLLEQMDQRHVIDAAHKLKPKTRVTFTYLDQMNERNYETYYITYYPHTK